MSEETKTAVAEPATTESQRSVSPGDKLLGMAFEHVRESLEDMTDNWRSDRHVAYSLANRLEKLAKLIRIADESTYRMSA